MSMTTMLEMSYHGLNVHNLSLRTLSIFYRAIYIYTIQMCLFKTNKIEIFPCTFYEEFSLYTHFTFSAWRKHFGFRHSPHLVLSFFVRKSQKLITFDGEMEILNSCFCCVKYGKARPCNIIILFFSRDIYYTTTLLLCNFKVSLRLKKIISLLNS
jgi:hypothetical protein